MKITFIIDYTTVFGEEVVLYLHRQEQEKTSIVSAHRMYTSDGLCWTCTIDLDPKRYGTVINYHYAIERDNKTIKTEWLQQAHRLMLSPQMPPHITIYDHWVVMPEDAYRYSSAFTQCLHPHATQAPQPIKSKSVVRLIVRAPQLRKHQQLALVGEQKALGQWNAAQALPMYLQNDNEWYIDLDAAAIDDRTLTFKFITQSVNNEPSVLWETGNNRTITLPAIDNDFAYIYTLDQAFFAIENERVAGTLVPVFSLRTQNSFGIGDFGDLKMMIDFVALTGQKVLQVLPINDTTITHTWTDSYPYSCISVFALHPQYVDLNQLPELKDAKHRKHYEKLRKKLNALSQIDYEQVNNAKIAYLQEIYQQEGEEILQSPRFVQFFAQESSWLVPYARYCTLRDSYGTADFTTWATHKRWEESERKALSTPGSKAYKAVAFHYFVQYILFSQMQSAHEYAQSKGVILKGDIPIGVHRHSCDVWQEPEYFHLDGQAGAPPDDFSVRGQNWGFPTYNWEAMLADGCRWWNKRFQSMQRYFDAYRIDHVLGFFRIWEIPIHSVHGLLGQFSPAIGMSPEEIEAYGLHFNEDHFTRPFIADWVLQRVFGKYAETIKQHFLDHRHDDIFDLKPQYDTQRKIEAAYENGEFAPLVQTGDNAEQAVYLRDGLMSLASDVLFVRDKRDPKRFHPRISVQFDFIYEALYDSDKAAFNRLYNDYFYRRNNDFWYHEAMKKLPALVQSTSMLVCAEDLGMVPDCVPWVMNELRILSLELQSMPKDPKVRFGHLSANPYRSVSIISSHDMPTLRQWWDEDWERTQEYYNSMLYHGGPAPHPLPGDLATYIIAQHLASPSMLCVLSIQDWMAMDEQLRLADADAERINIPANPRHYWRYRMHKSIEELMQEKHWVEQIRSLIASNGR